MKLFSITPASRSYTANMLPKNRKEVFFDILRLHWGKFLGMGSLIFLFSLPIHFCAFFCNFLAASYENSEEAIDVFSFQLQNLRMIINIPLLMLLAVPFAGIMRILRQYAWEENVFFFYDFSKGIRQNLGQTLAIALIGGCTFMLSAVCFRMASSAGGVAAYIACIPMGIFSLLIFPLCSYTVSAIPVYSNSLLRNFKAALLVYSKKPLQTLGVSACLCAVFLLSYIPNVYVSLFGRIVGSFSVPVILFAWNLFCYDGFDQFINIHEHVELVKKGLLGLKYHDR